MNKPKKKRMTGAMKRKKRRYEFLRSKEGQRYMAEKAAKK